jgi:hypothetical protein
LTAADLRKDITNDSFSSYFYVGDASDVGWENAELAYGLFSRLRVYLIKDASTIKEWTGSKRPRGVVFGWGATPRKYLNQDAAEDLKELILAIKEVRGE